jgi:ACS family hexuronate transporter-like MFS transporter
MFPKRAVASVTGIGGMAGSVGGIALSLTAGKMLANYTAQGRIEVGYGIMFIICGVAYLLAWVAMHLLAPKFRLVELD